MLTHFTDDKNALNWERIFQNITSEPLKTIKVSADDSMNFFNVKNMCENHSGCLFRGKIFNQEKNL